MPQRGLLYTENQSWGRLGNLSQVTQQVSGFVPGSSAGLANGNDADKPSSDFKEVLTPVKVMPSAVAGVIPTNTAAEFLS